MRDSAMRYSRRAAGSLRASASRPSASAGAISSRWSGAMAAFGGLGFATEARAAKPDQARARREARQGAGVPLRRRRLVPERALQPRLQQGSVLLGRARALRRARWSSMPTSCRCRGWRARWRATRTARSGRSRSGRTAAGRTTAPVSARATSSGRGSASSIRPARRPTPRSSTTSRTARPSTRSRSPTRARSGSRAKDDWTLEVTLEGPRGYFPVLAAYLAALPAHKRRGGEVRRQVDGGRQHRLQRAVHARGVGAQQADRAQEEPALLRRQGRAPDAGGDPDHPGRPRARCPTRTTSSTSPRCRPATSSACSPTRGCRRTSSAIRSRVPGTCCPRSTKPPFDNMQGPPGGGARHRPRERRQGEPGARDPRLVHDPARLPGRRRRPEDQGHPAVRQEGRDGACSRARPTRAARTGRRSR